MTYDDIRTLNDCPHNGVPFCENGNKQARRKIKSIDPITKLESVEAYDAGNGFLHVFQNPHSALAESLSVDGEPLHDYNNYVTTSDINLIFYLASLGTILPNIGFPYEWKHSLSEGIGGYPFGAIVRDASGQRFISTKNDNTDPIEEGSLSWIKYRNSNWFNYSNHVQGNDGESRQFTGPAKCMYLKMIGGGLKEPSKGTPVFICRKHAVYNKVEGTTTAWFQAYKYWIRQDALDLTSLWYEDEYGNFQQCGYASISEFKWGDSSKIISPLSAPRHYEGQKGAYLITWGKDESGTSMNPFSSVEPKETYNVPKGSVSDYELALDLSKFEGAGNIFIKQEFDAERSELTCKLAPADLPNLKGLIRLGGEVLAVKDDQKDPSEDNVIEGSILRSVDLSCAESIIGDEYNSMYAGKSSSIPLNEPLPETLVPDLPFSFWLDGASHQKLSNDPTIIRRGVEITLVLRPLGDNPKDIPIQTLYRNMWTEVACLPKVQTGAVGGRLVYAYQRTIIPDTADRKLSPWQSTGPQCDMALIPDKLGEGSGDLYIVAKFHNIPMSRRFKVSEVEPNDYYDDTYGMYYPGYPTGSQDRFRTYYSIRTVPYEMKPNSITKKSFNVPPTEW